MATLIDYDLMVTWRLPDGSTREYPATVCFRDDEDFDEVSRRAAALMDSVEHTLGDSPDELVDAVPVAVRFEES